MAAFLIPDGFITQKENAQRDAFQFSIPPTAWRVHDAMGTNIGTAGNDDLGLLSGTIGTAGTYLTSGDLKSAGATTRYARVQVPLPPEYYAAETVTVRLYTDMTAAADASATVDVQCYEMSKSAGTVGSDLCTTAATDCNSTTAAAKDFTITSTGLSPGDILDIRIAATVTDAAGVADVSVYIYQVALLLDIRG